MSISLALAGSLIGLAAAGGLAFWVVKQEDIPRILRHIPAAIEEGARAYLLRLNGTLLGLAVFLAILMGFAFGTEAALIYLSGCFFSSLAGIIGMAIATRANSRTTQAALKGLDKAFQIAFRSGSVMGLSVEGLALLGLSLVYLKFHNDFTHAFAFSFGASSFALLGKVGGGVYTKIADIGADLAGKAERGIPEDDPRNPAVIADLVGDIVGDVFGTGADMFDSLVASIVVAMSLGDALPSSLLVVFPLQLCAIGIFASLVGIALTRCQNNQESPAKILSRSSLVTTGCFLLLTETLVWLQKMSFGLFLATAAGTISGVVIGYTAELFTGVRSKPVRLTAEAAFRGTALNILTGNAFGMISAVLPTIGLGIAMAAAWHAAAAFGISGLYGVAISAVGMLATCGMVMSADAYGPIADNAQGIAKMARYNSGAQDVVKLLDAVGNTTKAMTKGYSIGSAGLTVIALVVSFIQAANLPAVALSLANPAVMVGLFVGIALPGGFAAILILAVCFRANDMVDEVRRQFRELGLLSDPEAKPDYAQCVDISTRGALKSLVLPAILMFISPISIRLLIGKAGLGAFLVSNLLAGVFIAIWMANSGAILDNSKKLFEGGEFDEFNERLAAFEEREVWEEKVARAYTAAVEGDTFGDPEKDTAGPSQNTWNTILGLIAHLILRFGL